MMVYHQPSQKLFCGMSTNYYRTVCGESVQDVACADVCVTCRRGPRVTCQACLQMMNFDSREEWLEDLTYQNEAARILGTLPMAIEQPAVSPFVSLEEFECRVQMECDLWCGTMAYPTHSRLCLGARQLIERVRRQGI